MEGADTGGVAGTEAGAGAVPNRLPPAPAPLSEKLSGVSLLLWENGS